MAVAMAGAFPVAEKAVAREIISSQNPLRELNSFVISEVWLQTCIAKNNGLCNCRFKSQNQTLGKYFIIYEAATRLSDIC